MLSDEEARAAAFRAEQLARKLAEAARRLALAGNPAALTALKARWAAAIADPDVPDVYTETEVEYLP